MGFASEWKMEWSDVDNAMQALITNIKIRNAYDVDTIVAVAKGGLIPATLLWQQYPNAKFVVLHTSSYTPLGKVPPKILNPQVLVHQIPDCGNTLIVDDICDSGDTFRCIERQLPNAQYAAMLVRDAVKDPFEYDFLGHAIQPGVWVDFPWERKPVDSEVVLPF